jgi:AraC-like DNA-binding protein
VDVLSDIFDAVRLRGKVYFQLDYSPPWGVRMERGPLAIFHVVARGSCFFWTTGMDDPILLSAGDVVALPRGDAHWVADDPAAAMASGRRLLEAYREGRQLFGGERVAATLVCGHVELDRSFDHPLMRQLPPLIHVRGADRSEHGWLRAVASVIVEETRAMRPGYSAIVDRLSEVLFLHLHRAHLLEADSPGGYWAALSDPQINRALSLIHESPQARWTLESLAGRVGMSRTAFAVRFRESVGMPPMHYLAHWRMHKARELLRDPEPTLAAVAKMVGYGSEAAFIRAFRRRFEQNPGEMRKALGSGTRGAPVPPSGGPGQVRLAGPAAR